MNNFLVIRSYKPSDLFYCQEILYSSVMSLVSPAFYSSFTREITYEVMILLSAVLFIYFGIPLLFCLTFVLLVPLIILLFIWFSYKVRASQVAQELDCVFRIYMTDLKTHFWVAEILERADTESSSSGNVDHYSLVSEKDSEYLNERDNFRRKTVGTIAVSRNGYGPGLVLEARIQRLAVHPSYEKHKISVHLIKKALKFCWEQKYKVVEIRTTECEESDRFLYRSLGFELKNMFHKEILGQLVTVAQYDLEYNLDKWPADSLL